MQTTTQYNIRDQVSNKWIIPAIFLMVAEFHEVVQIVLVKMAGREPFFDAIEYWFPIAKGISNGAVLYSGMYDNKTPLWHLLNYAVYSTGHYYYTFYLFVGVANASIAYLLYVWVRDSGYGNGGLIAAGMYLIAIPQINADIINVRSFGLAFLLMAILSKRSRRCGIYTAIAVLFNQFILFAIPFLVYDGYVKSNNGNEWVGKYVVSGSMVAIVCFLPLVAIWSFQTMIDGIQYSFLGVGKYIVGHGDHSNPFIYPKMWALKIFRAGRSLSFVIIPFTLAGSYALYSRRVVWDTFGMSVCLSIVFLGILLLKALTYYWMPPVVFMAVVAGIGIETWFRG